MHFGFNKFLIDFAAAMLAAPMAKRSWFASTGASSGRTVLRPTAMLSLAVISVIPNAPGHSSPTSEKSGNDKKQTNQKGQDHRCGSRLNSRVGFRE
jgi:hypothetical protein